MTLIGLEICPAISIKKFSINALFVGYFLGDSKFNYYILVWLRGQEMDLIWAPLLEILSVCWGDFLGNMKSIEFALPQAFVDDHNLTIWVTSKLKSHLRNLARWYHLIPVILPRNSGYFSDVSCKICRKIKRGRFL